MATTAKLRILSFPQRIHGKVLEINVLVLPTQGLLNDIFVVNSKLKPGTTVQLPRFIQGNIRLESTTIKGLSSYPFSDPALLAAEGVTQDKSPADIAFPANIQAIYEGL